MRFSCSGTNDNITGDLRLAALVVACDFFHLLGSFCLGVFLLGSSVSSLLLTLSLIRDDILVGFVLEVLDVLQMGSCS